MLPTPRRRGRRFPAVRAGYVLAVTVGFGLLGSFGRASESDGQPVVVRSRPPSLIPDYREIVIPPNVAPLNFRVEEPGQDYHLRIHGAHGEVLELRNRSADIEIPLPAWRELLHANRGSGLEFEIATRSAEGSWQRFSPFTNMVAREPIDGFLVYRLLHPAYSLYGELGIYQRELASFEETPLLENRHFDGGCVNCHTFNANRPDTMAIHLRQPGTGNPMLLVRSNEVLHISKTAGYLAWHPSGQWLAYSSNQFRLLFHTQGETRDVVDLNSDLGLYRLDRNTLVVPSFLARPDRQENWPCWSPDGRHLYYCSAPKLRLERFERVRYDLMRVAFDPAQEQWGEPELLVSGAELRQSLNEPRVSPDGRWLLCVTIPYGNFPPYQPESDLHLYDVVSRQLRKLELNSDQCDSYPCWSSNGRWIVFSSKRRDGLFSLPYFSHVDEQGRFSKPWLLPQATAAFYDASIDNFNRPELVSGPVPVRAHDLVRALRHPTYRKQPQSPPGQPPGIDGPDQPFEQPGQAGKTTSRPDGGRHPD